MLQYVDCAREPIEYRQTYSPFWFAGSPIVLGHDRGCLGNVFWDSSEDLEKKMALRILVLIGYLVTHFLNVSA